MLISRRLTWPFSQAVTCFWSVWQLCKDFSLYRKRFSIRSCSEFMANRLLYLWNYFPTVFKLSRYQHYNMNGQMATILTTLFIALPIDFPAIRRLEKEILFPEEDRVTRFSQFCQQILFKFSQFWSHKIPKFGHSTWSKAPSRWKESPPPRPSPRVTRFCTNSTR